MSSASFGGSFQAGIDVGREAPKLGSQLIYPRGTCVPHLVSGQAAAAPNAIALTHGKLSLTYKELDERANQLAYVLRSLGAGPDGIVGLYLNRSLAMVVGALAILKAGGAYLPLDPSDPPGRLAFVMEDARSPILLTEKSLVDELPVRAHKVVTVDPEGRLAALATSEPTLAPTKAEDLAYVIYTSGSTGQPKGVEITHRSLVNLVFWHQRAFRVSSADRASQLSALSFDAAIWELWPYLAAGASVHLPDDLTLSEPEAVRDWMVSQGITIGFLPTPLAERVIRIEWPEKTALRVLLTGADTLHHYPPRTLPFQLVNNYGPTECTVVATSGAVLPEGHTGRLPTIGRPIANTEIYILNEGMQQVPIGELGEIYIGGAGLARGYRNRPDLTSERFVPNPFSSEPDARIYRTGDLARSLPDGQIVFLGRVDEQVKIRGFRVEPAEIVTILDQHPAVKASIVLAREVEPGDKRLIAYFVSAAKLQPTHTELRDFIAARLPEYMTPAIFVKLDALPLNPSGKVNRTDLPEPNAGNILRDISFVEPRTPIEKRMAEILAALLDLGQVSVEDNFFLLGGHSLLGTQLIARVRGAFGVELGLRTLFESPTVAELSARIQAALLAKLRAMSEAEAHRILGTTASVPAEENPK